MVRPKVIRNAEEKQEFLKKLRERNKINQQRCRQKQNKNKKKPTSNKSRQKKYRKLKRQGTPSDNCDYIKEHYIGPMNVLCVFCNAKHFPGEILTRGKKSFNDCCSHGGVPKCSFTNFPTELRQLLTNAHEHSTEFLNNIRRYNSSLSFASFNANLMNFKSQRRGPYCFKIKGSIYYQINTSLYPKESENASFGQLYILDPLEANEQRMENMEGLNLEILEILDKIIRKNNTFAKSYRMMKEQIAKLEKKSRKKGIPIPEVKMSFIPKTGTEARRYNPQKANEIAAVFTTTADGDIPDTYITIYNNTTNKYEYLKGTDPKAEPWIYPLLYPFGTLGWHPNMMRSDKESRRITRSAYVKNLIADRNEFNPFLYAGRLFQQWIVDMYVKVEKDRIQYCRDQQKKLRADSYQGVIDYMKERSQAEGLKIGKMIILPSSFIGSPRNMAQNYQDAMAIVRKYGKPDLFITMTCNPNWREIRENLKFHQQVCNRPDLVTRVFNLKKNALLETIIDKEIFGKVQAYIYVVEFQKRGLPHIHLLITLKKNYKITSIETVDKMISAEIPDPEKKPRLFDIVMANMIHGPCGDWCMVNGKCSKMFPKSFQKKTSLDEDGYPSYRRRDTGEYYERPNNYIVDNRFVVPYSPYLLYRFNCHCNVEKVSSIKSVKYLYKYLYKGHDSANLVMEGTATNVTEIVHDEIKEHIEARYVGPVEACWRILNKKLQDKSHPILRLPVHLPNQQNITINPGAENVNLDNIVEQKNMLIDYFELNKRDKRARKYLYVDIPSHYTFKKTKINNKYIGQWKKRKACFQTIGRMYSVSPSQVELYHLRLLLLTTRGAKSFTDLKIVNNELHPTFTAACIALGLIADDYEWNRAMTEAEIWMMPYQLRRLFARILIHCHPIYPEQLWNEFQTVMSEDFCKKNVHPIQAKDKALQQIAKFLEEEGKSLKDFGITHNIDNKMDTTDHEMLSKIFQQGLHYYKQLNGEQKTITDLILNATKSNGNSQNLFYIDGPGGSGKTFIYITLWHLLTGQEKKISMMAYTGIAATLLPNGKTVHKTLGLPVPLYPDSTSTIKITSKEANILKETDIFIWDEAPMAPRYALEVMDRLLRDIMDNSLPFGGKVVVLGGDFRQLLPVNVHGTRGETVNLSIKFSSLWNFFKIHHLTKNMRALPEEIEFSNFLLDIGNGKLNDKEDNVVIPDFCINSKDEIAEAVYSDILKKQKFKEAAKCAILSARNIDVDDINKQVVELLDINTERIYTSVDSADNCNKNDEIVTDLLPEYLNTLTPTSLPPHELRLRKYCIVMLIRNLSINEGLCNGTRLLVLDLGNNLLRCEILTGDKTGDIVFLNRITFICDDIYPFTFTRRQFPIKLAFAITINKSQGQTFEKIGIDLRKDVFNHGQLYVALSRVRSWNAVKIYVGCQRINNIVKNYVFEELYHE